MKSKYVTFARISTDGPIIHVLFNWPVTNNSFVLHFLTTLYSAYIQDSPLFCERLALMSFCDVQPFNECDDVILWLIFVRLVSGLVFQRREIQGIPREIRLLFSPFRCFCSHFMFRAVLSSVQLIIFGQFGQNLWPYNHICIVYRVIQGHSNETCGTLPTPAQGPLKSPCTNQKCRIYYVHSEWL